jgi:hypothetical protein
LTRSSPARVTRQVITTPNLRSTLLRVGDPRCADGLEHFPRRERIASSCRLKPGLHTSESFSRGCNVLCNLFLQRLEGRKLLFVAQLIDEHDFHVLLVEIAFVIQEMRLNP